MKTLIEKLEAEIVDNNAKFEDISEFATEEMAIAHTGTISGLMQAIITVRNHSDWIPCSERLPEASGEYLVFWTDEEISVANYCADRKIWSAYPFADVKFWQPLPQPPSEVQP